MINYVIDDVVIFVSVRTNRTEALVSSPPLDSRLTEPGQIPSSVTIRWLYLSVPDYSQWQGIGKYRQMIESRSDAQKDARLFLSGVGLPIESLRWI